MERERERVVSVEVKWIFSTRRAPAKLRVTYGSHVSVPACWEGAGTSNGVHHDGQPKPNKAVFEMHPARHPTILPITVNFIRVYIKTMPHTPRVF